MKMGHFLSYVQIRKLRNLVPLILYALPFVFSFALLKLLIVFYGEEQYATYVVAFGSALIARITFFNAAQSIFLRYFGLEGDKRLVALQFRKFQVLGLIFPTLLSITLLILIASDRDYIIAGQPLVFASGFLLGCGLGGLSAIAEVDNAHFSRSWGGGMIVAIPILQAAIVPIAASMNLHITGYLALTGAGLLLCSVLYSQHFFGRVTGALSSKTTPFKLRTVPEGFYRYLRQLSYWVIPTLALKAADRLIVESSLNDIEMAAFGACLMLTERVYAASATVFTRFFNRKIFSGLDGNNLQENHRAVSHLFTFQITLVIGLTALYYVFGEQILRLVASDKIASEVGLLVGLALAMGLVVASEVRVLHGHIEAKPNPFLIARVATGSTYLVLLLALVPESGTKGLIIAAFGSAGVALFGTAVASRIVQRTRTEVRL